MLQHLHGMTFDSCARFRRCVPSPRLRGEGQGEGHSGLENTFEVLGRFGFLAVAEDLRHLAEDRDRDLGR